MDDDYYKILGVVPSAGTAEIRKAYLTLARDRHPDRFTDPGEKRSAGEFFAKLSEAFNTLSNERGRRRYDEQLASPQPRTPAEMAAQAFAEAKQYLSAAATNEAVEAARIAVAHGPEEARYHLLLGQALRSKKPVPREAVESLERAVRLDPRLAPAHAELARAFLDSRLTIRARRVVEQGLEVLPGDVTLQKLAQELGVGSPPEESGGGLRSLWRKG